MKPYETVAPANTQTRLEPYRAPTIHSDIRVPVGQAAFIGGGVGTLVVLIALGLDAPFTVRDYALTWAIVSVALTLVTFVWRLLWTQNTVMRLERWTGKDLPGGYQGGPPPLFNPGAARVEAARTQQAIQRDDEVDDLVMFVYALQLKGTSEAAQEIPPTPKAREAYAAKRDTLIQLGIARWKDAKRRKLGWELVLTPEQAAPLVRKHVLGRSGAN